ncbi:MULTISPECIES: hypothetical protein [unclassified Mesorhizobium]|uniref:hypothetical protein n=1 Tax=unclassified Mesorhizobium TaxID=325217 RepID=UPI001AEF2032|nr:MULTISPECIES: hypothetical protein [unclassified Mesorhizobium]
MKLILTAMEPNLADAWAKEFRGVANVQIHRGSIFDVEADALVSPANSYGFMDGGIDAQYSRVLAGISSFDCAESLSTITMGSSWLEPRKSSRREITTIPI